MTLSFLGKKIDMLWKIRKKILSFILKFRYSNVTIENFSFIGAGTHFCRNRKIKFGSGFSCGIRCHFAAQIEAGDDIMIASNVAFVGGDHAFDEITTTMNRSGRALQKGIKLGNNIWLGHGVIVMDGVEISDGVVVGSGSVVTKNLEKNGSYAGNPARFIRHRKVVR